MKIPKIITPNKHVIKANWNKYLPQPLKAGEKVKVDKNQEGVSRDYVRVKHGESGSKMSSIFHIRNFETLKGEAIGN